MSEQGEQGNVPVAPPVAAPAPTTPATEAPASGEAGLPPSVAAELENLRAFRTQAEADYAALQPVREDVVRLINDERAREFYRGALKNYDTLREQQPEYPPEIKPVLEGVRKIEERLDKRDQAEEQTRAQAMRERGEREWQTVYKLAESNPWLAKDNYAAVSELVDWANRHRLGDADFQSVFDSYTTEMQARFGAVAQERTPPRSLRADAGTAGIPGPKGPGPITSQADIRERIRAGLRQQRAAIGG